MSVIDDLIKDSLKAGDKTKTVAYRAVKSKMLLEQKKGGDVPAAEKLLVWAASKEIREREESNTFIKDTNHPDFQANQAIIDVLQTHLPKKYSEQEQTQLVNQAIRDAGAAVKADLGKVMKLLTPHRDKLDMAAATAQVKAALDG